MQKEDRLRVGRAAITPEVAEVLWHLNWKNRNFRPGVGARYARDMRNERFLMPPDAIAVSDPDGKFDFARMCQSAAYRRELLDLSKDELRHRGIALLNGQHRAWAVKDTAITIPSLWVTGYELDDHRFMDQGAGRNGGDVMRLEGFSNSSQSAAVLSGLYRWNLNNGKLFSANSDKYPTPDEMLALADEHPRLLDAVGFGRYITRKLRVSIATAVVLYYVTSEINEGLARKFWSSLISGAGLQRDDPVFVLREQLMEAAGKHHVSTNQQLIYFWVVSAWNDWLKRRKRTRAYKLKDDMEVPALIMPPKSNARSADDGDSWWLP